MKKTTQMLLIAALAPVLCFAQEKPATKTPSASETLVAAAQDATTLDQVAALETQFAAAYKDWTANERISAMGALVNAAMKAKDQEYALEILTKYTPDFETSTNWGVWRYYSIVKVAPWYAQRAALQVVKTPAALDALLAGYFGTSLYPARLLADGQDNRTYSLAYMTWYIATAAARVNHPQAVNFALAAYRTASMADAKALDRAVSSVAAALKAADMNLARANAWIDSQNTGQPGVTFTSAELATPAVLASVPAVAAIVMADPAKALAAAKAQYRVAATSKAIDAAIYGIADVLKAHDLNLARANAWIAAQKGGESFDLTLEAK